MPPALGPFELDNNVEGGPGLLENEGGNTDHDGILENNKVTFITEGYLGPSDQGRASHTE